MTDTNAAPNKPIVLITGCAGRVGTALSEALQGRYHVVGVDRPGKPCDIEMDITSEQSIAFACEKFSRQYGSTVAVVVHLAAYFDFSGETSPLYDKVNSTGTRRLLDALQAFHVTRFIYASTMLVHQPATPGDTIDEQTAIAPRWAYPQSKAATEAVIREHPSQLPYVIVRLAGLYDDATVVPTLAHQIANIYERDLKSLLHAGDIHAGQSCLHLDDMVDLFGKIIAKRNDLPARLALLAGETEVMSYRDLQHHIGKLIHGENQWRTLSLPSVVAKAGAWLEAKAEPIIPDDFDAGEKPFIKPFMIDLAKDHYALNIQQAKSLLDWQPRHHLQAHLPKIIRALKRNPPVWYENNGVNMPNWMRSATDKQKDPERLRQIYERCQQRQHQKYLWAHFVNAILGCWLISAPSTSGYLSAAMSTSNIVSGTLVVLLSAVSLSSHPRCRKARWLLGAIGIWVMSAPLIFWAPTAAAYLDGTLIGALITALALLTRPFPGLSPVAAVTGPDIPPGWDFSPSDWFQRLPIIALAVLGFFISRYLAAYQLGHTDAVWEPFFIAPDTASDLNGTEHIISSSLSQAWPVPDAGLGALTYMLEILTGVIGSRARWRTMPWLVLLFGFMIIPLGAVSITFIIIQPILLGTWCTLCLIAAAAMLLQIPYSFDEIVATIQFLKRRAEAGQPWMRILFTGDTDQGERKKPHTDDFTRPPLAIVHDMLRGGVSVSWQLASCAGIGIWLMCTQLTLGNQGSMADADHLIGALVLTVTVTSFAEVMRTLRLLNIFLALALLITPFVLGASNLATFASVICGLALIALSIPRGSINTSYGSWNRVIF